MGTPLGTKYIAYTHMDPLGKSKATDALPRPSVKEKPDMAWTATAGLP